jgi:hypothetical protein
MTAATLIAELEHLIRVHGPHVPVVWRDGSTGAICDLAVSVALTVEASGPSGRPHVTLLVAPVREMQEV